MEYPFGHFGVNCTSCGSSQPPTHPNMPCQCGSTKTRKHLSSLQALLSKNINILSALCSAQIQNIATHQPLERILALPQPKTVREMLLNSSLFHLCAYCWENFAFSCSRSNTLVFDINSHISCSASWYQLNGPVEKPLCFPLSYTDAQGST